MAFFITAITTANLVIANDYPASLEAELANTLQSVARDNTNTHLFTKVASLYLDLGTDVYAEKEKRITVYEQGARFAMRALQINERIAEAHFLYAANLGSAAQLKGFIASAAVVQTLKTHVRRALELQDDHAPASHMLGVMLDELPWLLGGDRKAALESVKRAVAVDPAYAAARLDLAKMYLKRKDPESAKRELRTLIGLVQPRDQYAWANRYRPEGLRLLAELSDY